MAGDDSPFFIRNYDLWCQLSDEEYKDLKVQHAVIEVPRGEYIYFEAYNHNKVYFVKEGTIKIGYIDDDGKLVGFEIDLAHEIAKDLLGDPNKIEFVVLQSDGRFPSVLSGKIDFGMCSTTIYPERAIRIAFTRPYLDTGNSFIVRKDAGIKTIQELNDSKYTFATLNVPPAIERAKMVMPNVKLLLLDSPSALFLATKTGRATAFSIDKPIADYYEHENTDLTRLDVSGTIFNYVANDSLFLKPGDFKWWLYLDTYIRELREGTRYYKYVEWYRKWLHKDPPPQRSYDFNKY